MSSKGWEEVKNDTLDSIYLARWSYDRSLWYRIKFHWWAFKVKGWGFWR